jgi:hypothetical protein
VLHPGAASDESGSVGGAATGVKIHRRFRDLRSLISDLKNDQTRNNKELSTKHRVTKHKAQSAKHKAQSTKRKAQSTKIIKQGDMAEGQIKNQKSKI